ncbi:MAG: ubiquinol-cytochrome c reductase cytochrome b subunit [Actinobacteria bacterium]|nr:ubiquinol-cytochrome c reductase cytochrome b subunit [Actinomycetota bacterium]
MKPADWVDRRLRLAGPVNRALSKVFPTHWSFMLGEIALYAFVVLVATGIFLTLFFEASLAETVYTGAYEPLRGLEVSRAYASTLELSFDVRAGLLIRQTHHWAALVFVGAIVAHLLRVFLTGAFRRPRELNWMIGVTLLALAMLSGFTGYSLPDDLLSGTGLRIAWSSALAIPFVGDDLAFLLFGGEYPGDIVSRLYPIHILIVPALLAGLIAAHLAIVIRQKHTQLPGPGRTEHDVVGEPLWAGYALKSLALLFSVAAVLVALGAFVQINPVWLYGPYEPFAVTSPAQPDWYLMWVEGALRIYPPWEIGLLGVTVPDQFVPAVLLPGLTFAALYAWPFLERRVTGDRDEHELAQRPRERPGPAAFGLAALTFYALLTLSVSNAFIARLLAVSVLDVTRALRVLVLVLPPLVGLVAYRVLRALAATGASGALHVPARALLRRHEQTDTGAEK